MSEQIAQETGVIDQAVAPEVNASPEIPEVNQAPETGAINTPEIPAEQAAPQPPSEIEMYQDVLAKHEADSNYDMSDDEAAAFLSVQDQINSGKIEEPKAKQKEGKAPEKTEVPENSTGDTPTENEETPAPSEFKLSDDQASKLQKAMTLVGAKDIGELDDKIDGLINNMKSSGGKLGTELKAMQESEANHKLWLKDLSEGKPEAIAYLETITGKKPATQSVNTPEADTGEFLDDELATIVLSQKKVIEELTSTVKGLSDGAATNKAQSQRTEATGGWVNDIVSLVTDNATDFNLTPSEALHLSKDYWAEDGHTKAVNPKFQQIHDLLTFAHENNYPNLESAHVMHQRKTGVQAQKTAQTVRDAQKTTKYTPSVNSAISNQQGRNQANVSSPHIDETAVNKMVQGDFNAIPDEWMDESGTLVKTNIPERFHKQLFGGMG